METRFSNFAEPYGMLTFEAPKEMNLKVLNFLYDDDELKFQFSYRLYAAVHYPDQKGRELAVVYHLHNLDDNVRIRFKVFTDINTTGCLYCYGFIFCCQLDGKRNL